MNLMTERDGMRIKTEIGTTKHQGVSSAPNGSTRGNRDYYTVVTFMEDWISGPYAGYTYQITEEYISSTPTERGQLINSTSTFMFGPE